MSERRYKWGDPVWVKSGDTTMPAIVMAGNRENPFVVYLKPDNDWRGESFPHSDISPRDDDKPKTWRLPQEGDTVRILVSDNGHIAGDSLVGKEVTIRSVDWADAYPIEIEPNCQFDLSQIALVRLHDEPATDRFAAPGKVIEPSTIKLDSIVKINSPGSPLHCELVKVVATTYSGDSCQVLCLDGHTRVVKAEECVPSPGITNKAWEEAFEHDSKIKPSMPEEPTFDPVAKARHYNLHPSGVECITIVEHFDFVIGNIIKYAWRAGLKFPEKRLEDLRKCLYYASRAVSREEANNA